MLMDSLKVGEYMYKRYHNGFKIFKKEADGVFGSCEGEYYTTREEARKRVYELNGWDK